MSLSASPAIPPPAVSFRQAARFWLKLGLISFGGPAGQIALMHTELVDRRGWISEPHFLHALNFCMVLPGPEAQQLATYLGWLMHGNRGGLVAGVLFVLPSLVLIAALAWLYLAFGQLPLLAAVFYGIKPAVVAVVLFAAWRIGRRALGSPLHVALAVGAFVALEWLRVPFPLIVLGAACIGLLAGQRWLAQMGVPTAPRSGPAPAEASSRLPWGQGVRVCALGALLWLLPMAALVAGTGLASTWTTMGWFFTKAALLSFGGAYAVLPYVYQGAVERYGWISPAQMLDGLALGESTPGPLIMIVAFVGFIGSYTEAAFGPAYRPLAGAVGAAIATWFTFLPSFVFILAGAPLVEASRRGPAFTAPLLAISAAVVGVMLDLAAFFAAHVLFPAGLSAGPDGIAVMIALAAALGLFRFRWSPLTVLGGGALLGVAASVLRA